MTLSIGEASIDASSSRLLERDPQPVGALHFPLATPPASDWPAADSQATPTLTLQCGLPPLALQRRRRTPVRRPYCYVRTPTRATVRPTPTCIPRGVVSGGSMTYL